MRSRIDHYTPDLQRLPLLIVALVRDVQWQTEAACFTSLCQVTPWLTGPAPAVQALLNLRALQAFAACLALPCLALMHDQEGMDAASKLLL